MVLRLEDATSKRTRDAFDTEASDDRSGAHTRKQAMTALAHMSDDRYQHTSEDRYLHTNDD